MRCCVCLLCYAVSCRTPYPMDLCLRRNVYFACKWHEMGRMLKAITHIRLVPILEEFQMKVSPFHRLHYGIIYPNIICALFIFGYFPFPLLNIYVILRYLSISLRQADKHTHPIPSDRSLSWTMLNHFFFSLFPLQTKLNQRTRAIFL